MIEASFEQATHKSAAIGGIYQYDTGQRLRMHGLPTPEELAEMDDFLVGDAVTVQAQYGYIGDSQTETRLAAFDAQTGCWEAEIPDAYLTRSSAVKVFVYVSYGATEDEVRAKTCYEGSFTPISRPAPGSQVTPSQGNAWDALVAEINLTLSKMNTAISETNAAAENALEATKAANTQTDHLSKMTVQAATRNYGSGSTATLTDDGTKKVLTLGLERGPKGDKGDKGDKGRHGRDGRNRAARAERPGGGDVYPERHRALHHDDVNSFRSLRRPPPSRREARGGRKGFERLKRLPPPAATTPNVPQGGRQETEGKALAG